MSDVRKIIAVEEAVLAKNEKMAEALRAEFREKGVFAINVLSSPGSGKTELLAKTLERLSGQVSAAVIVGDLATDNDAKRMRGHNAPVVQITTDGRCHLEANMVKAAYDELGVASLKLLIIENVGNLVCPSSHDLGEHARVVMLSVTEGEDKPMKYPVMFKTADLIVVSKIDIAEAVGFNRELALGNIRAVAPQAKILEVSARTGEGMDAWLDWLLKSCGATGR